MSPPPAWPIGFQTILVRAVLYVLFIGAITQGAYLEALYLPSVRFSELGFTEFTQTLVLATCCARVAVSTMTATAFELSPKFLRPWSAIQLRYHVNMDSCFVCFDA